MKEKNGYETTEKNNSKGFKLNRKQLYTLSITTNKFLSLFGIKSKCHVNHDDMESIIEANGRKVPKRVRLQTLSYNELATGKYVLVRDGNGSVKNTSYIPYDNPNNDDLERFCKEKGIVYKKKR